MAEHERVGRTSCDWSFSLRAVYKGNEYIKVDNCLCILLYLHTNPGYCFNSTRPFYPFPVLLIILLVVSLSLYECVCVFGVLVRRFAVAQSAGLSPGSSFVS